LPRLHHINRNRRLKRESKTIPIPGHKDYGDGEDDGRYFHCWYCGFVCNKERDELGGPEDRANVRSQPYSQVDQYGDSAGTTRYEPVVDTGCPLCGSLNWRGDYP
jgi:hypothetical protein